MNTTQKDIKGRGASSNPQNRYEKLNFTFEATDENFNPEERPKLKTEFFRDFSKSILSENNSPDVGFRYSINPYRGCEHGCAYCYARPTHEYLGYSAGLDFESKIFVKENAPELLKKALLAKNWKGDTIAISGNTDCYQPIERKLQITRRCIEVLCEFRNPLFIISKNALVTRDIDLLKPLADAKAVMVFLSVTSLDPELTADLEPRTSRPQARLNAVRELAAAGIPVGVNIAPVIPGLNDHEIPAILKEAAAAGATSAGFTPVRLPLTVAPLFVEWLETKRPLKKQKVLTAIEQIRGGKLNDPNFGSRMRGEGPIAENLRQLFKIYSQKYGFNEKKIELSPAHFNRPSNQLSLF